MASEGAVKGAAVIRRRMRLITRNVREEVAVGLDAAAEDLRRRAQGLAPQLEGDLIGSAKIRQKGRKDVVSRTIYFDSPYAVVRHEDFYNLGPVSSVKKSPDGAIGRKYLSRPFEANQRRYTREIGESIDRALRQSVR